MTVPGHLNGKRVLVVEDEPLIGMEIAAMLEEAGATVIGPAASVERAHALIAEAEDDLDAALLDVNVAGASIDSVSEALTALQVPFVFMTGYSPAALADLAPGVPVLSKPFMPDQVFTALASLLAA